MNILVPHSWLLEYLKTDAAPSDIAKALSLCSASVEKIEKRGQEYIYHLEITTNRIDMFSVYGIAREGAAILPRFGFQAKLKKLDTVTYGKTTKSLPLKIVDKDKLCPRILAVVLDNVKVTSSPKYIKERLEASGIRPLNNLVDITNYAMQEVGHPVHVFDYDRIKTTKMFIRYANNGEKLVTLDSKKHHLTNEDIIIDDGTGRIIDLPGIMGTENSVVVPETKRIVLFIESNNSSNIRRTSMRLGIRTQAATINEKNPDSELAKIALLRGINLYQKTADANFASDIIDIYQGTEKPKIITTSCDFINQRLGTVLKLEEIRNILKYLSFEVITGKEDKLNIIPPSFRQFDINIPEDIVEEVARIYGYHNLPSILPEGRVPILPFDWELYWENKIKNCLKYWGFNETYTFSLVSKMLLIKSSLNPEKCLKLSNPLTLENEYLRPTLLPSLLEAASKNQTVNNKLQFFEISMTYVPEKKESLPVEKPKLAILLLSKNYFDIKGIVENIFKEIGKNNLIVSENTKNSLFDFRNSALIENGIGYLGEIDKSVLEKFNIKYFTAACEIDCESLFSTATNQKTFIPLPKYPALIEDLTLIMPDNVNYFQVVKTIKSINTLISQIEYLDKYQNALTLRISYQSNEKTLTDGEVKKIRSQILSRLEKIEVRLKT